MLQLTFKAGAVPAPVAPWPRHPWLVKSGMVRTWGGDGALQAWLGTVLQPGCDALALGTGSKCCPQGCLAQTSLWQALAGS